MKDWLERSKFENLPGKNPTQTRYTRFMKMPYSDMESAFTKSQKEFKDFAKGILETKYSEYLEG